MTTPASEFDEYIAVDWSGARGARQPGIKMALARHGVGAPRLVANPAGGNWSRAGLVEWLNARAKKRKFLAGFDFTFAPPVTNAGRYPYGADFQARDAKSYWRLVEKIAHDEPDLGARRFVEHPRHHQSFLTTSAKGARYARHLRATELDCRAQALGRPESFYHLVGPSQVGMASLTGMRALLRLEGVKIWPFDKPDPDRPVVVEIFCRTFLAMAGAGRGKLRSEEELAAALKKLGSRVPKKLEALDDNAADALVSAAGLRAVAGERRYWNPMSLSPRLKRLEGWTFGVL